VTPHFHSWLAYVNSVLHTDAPKPNPNAYRVLLSLQRNFSPTWSSAQVLAAEISSPYYRRPLVTWSGQGQIDPAGFHQFEAVERFTLQAQSQDLVFRTLVVVAEAGEHPWVEIAGVNLATGVWTTATPHGLADGERVLVTSDEQLPDGVEAGWQTVEVVGPTTLRLQGVTPTSQGSGRRLFRIAGGAFRPVFYHTFETNVWIPARTSRSYRLATRVRG